uniref:Major facilitator superfamily (MFS) profile domain-containing protein n=1 Tax=uncultured Thiotrichaceae bacterium TaxID=298394 RepID=A0A6S6UII8_9GAMM|nr:MAG: Unknown protein [uncultured Thiotrichaceae bacterium]
MPVSACQQTRWSTIILLFAAGFLAAFQYAKIPFMLPDLLLQVPMSALQQASLLSVIGIVGVIGGVSAGVVCQIVGLRRTLLSGLAVAMLGAVLPLWVSDYSLLLLGRLIEGVGHMAIVVSVPTLMLPLCAATDRPKVMALWSCYFTATFVLTALAAPVLLKYAGWQGFAVIHALLLLIVFVGLRRAGVVCDLMSDAAHQLNPRHLLLTQWRLLRERRLLAIPAAFFGYTLLFVSLVSVVPKWIASSEQMAVSFSIMLPCAALLGTAVSLIMLARGVSGQQLVNVATSGLVLVGGVLLLLNASGVAAQALVILGFVFLGVLPAGIVSSLPRLFQAGDPDVVLVNGGLVQFGNLGNFIGSPLLALMLLSWGWVSVGLYLLLGAGVVGLCMCFIYPAYANKNPD